MSHARSDGDIPPAILQKLLHLKDGEEVTFTKEDGVYRLVPKCLPEHKIGAHHAGMIFHGKEKDAEEKALSMVNALNQMKNNGIPCGVDLTDGYGPLSGPQITVKIDERHIKTLGIHVGGKKGTLFDIEDVKSGRQSIKKVVKLETLNINGTKVWLAVSKKPQFTTLEGISHCGNEVTFFMPRVDGVTLKKLVENHISILSPTELRLFSLHFLMSMVDALKILHDIDTDGMKGASHCDLHSENVMLDRTNLGVQILDFDRVTSLNRGSESFHHAGLESDVVNIARLFCYSYIGQEFYDVSRAMDQLKLLNQDEKAATDILMCGNFLPPESMEELKMLLKMMYHIVADKTQEGYSDSDILNRAVKERLKGELKGDFEEAVSDSDDNGFTVALDKRMRQMAKKLLPEVEDRSCDYDMSGPEPPAPAEDTPVPTGRGCYVFLTELTQRLESAVVRPRHP